MSYTFIVKKFIKNVEDFTCENCGCKVIGNGYTNHCPRCLFSKHVDINPGDRLAKCGGLMKPIDIQVKKGEFSVIHECLSCNHTKKNRLSKDDNLEILLKITKN